jgi:myo-inositol 2-dehydrogenase / D-chiro-inositol 1-dehydrogenase
MKSKNEIKLSDISRRDFIKKTAIAAPVVAFPSAGFATGLRFSSEQKVRIGLIGCGGRGTQDAINCLNSAPNVELTAMGDLFEDQLNKSFIRLKEQAGDKVNVSDRNKFVGFDAYKGVMGTDVDLVLLTSTPHYRPIHVEAAVEAGKHIFMEKPVAVDPVGVRSIIASSEKAKKKGLTIVGGTQGRKDLTSQKAMDIIHSGGIGDLVGGHSYRLGDAMRNWGPPERKPEWSDMEWQNRNWYFYTWLCGDFIAEMHIHQLDAINWAFNGPPVSCAGFGGRQTRTGPEIGKWGNIFDHFAIEYKYPGDARINYMGTQIDNMGYYRTEWRIIGTKGNIFSGGGKTILDDGKKKTELERSGVNSSIRQHELQIKAIRSGQELNEGKQVAESTMTTIMGRMSSYTGKEVTWDWVMNESRLDLSPPKYEFGDLMIRPIPVPGFTPLI